MIKYISKSLKIEEDPVFSSFDYDPHSSVLEITPSVFRDTRGWFSEVLKGDIIDVKQANRSASRGGVVRGLHAQKGSFCQAKLVEALTEVIFDIIIDARPKSETFGVSKCYRLDPQLQNKLFVPRGFLHSFIVPTSTKNDALFNYFCDNVYDKESEICVCPVDVIQRQIGILRGWCYKDPQMDKEFHELVECKDEDLVFSEKDKAGISYDEWMAKVKNEYETKNAVWHR